MDLGAGFMADDRPARLASVEASATKALSLAPDHAFAHLVLGSFYSAVNRSDEAIAEFEHALILDRNLIYAHALIGMAKTALGRAGEAENHYKEALRLSPRDVSAHHWMSSAGTSKLHLAKDEGAVLWFRRAIEANRNFAFTHLSLAAALAHLGSPASQLPASAPAHAVRTLCILAAASASMRACAEPAFRSDQSVVTDFSYPSGEGCGIYQVRLHGGWRIPSDLMVSMALSSAMPR